ncbi:hypothetical protein Daus18300_000285 [Diaporthe australafricana]|uniref:Uncharacterized protein n=1 Tax=Diaporthe australafricana TaxID=127596 RepID=A0ABR3Y602_9PEZI
MSQELRYGDSYALVSALTRGKAQYFETNMETQYKQKFGDDDDTRIRINAAVKEWRESALTYVMTKETHLGPDGKMKSVSAEYYLQIILRGMWMKCCNDCGIPHEKRSYPLPLLAKDHNPDLERAPEHIAAIEHKVKKDREDKAKAKEKARTENNKIQLAAKQPKQDNACQANAVLQVSSASTDETVDASQSPQCLNVVHAEKGTPRAEPTRQKDPFFAALAAAEEAYKSLNTDHNSNMEELEATKKDLGLARSEIESMCHEVIDLQGQLKSKASELTAANACVESLERELEGEAERGKALAHARAKRNIEEEMGGQARLQHEFGGSPLSTHSQVRAQQWTEFKGKTAKERRAASCLLCDSQRHGTGDCPGGYDIRHGDVPICPPCHSTSAHQLRGHTFDTIKEAEGNKDWGCRDVREAVARLRGFGEDAESRDFLTQHLLVDRKGKAPIRAYRQENCFVAFGLELSQRWCGGEMPAAIGSVWPLTKEDAVRHRAALKNWHNLAPEDRPQSSLDSLEIGEIRRQYQAGLIPPQVFDSREDIAGRVMQIYTPRRI